MKIAVLKEAGGVETRVAATPETVKKMMALGASVAVESGAGFGAKISDADYAAAGATVAPRSDVIAGADMVLGVQGPALADLPGIKAGTILAAIQSPFSDRAKIDAYAGAGLIAYAMELMPRTTRAQSMDVLSSQSNLAGYKAVIDAGEAYGRLGGLVSATDVRAATKEQIESLGAKAIFVEKVAGISGEGAGGYATEMSDEYKAAQAELVSSHIAKQDIVITTALIPGRPAPRLVTDAQVASMRPGSVIVDLAVDSGGNVEGAVAGEIVERHGVKIIGHKNPASRLAPDASALYSRNLFNMINAFWDKEAKAAVWPADDDIVKGIKLTEGGKIVHERLLG
jgi:NAD(P) transhydrogenase subunit alpha